MEFIFQILPIFLSGAILGIVGYRFYQNRLIRFLPELAPIKMEAFFSESHYLGEDRSQLEDLALGLIISIENTGDKDIHFESWSIRALNGRANLRQLFQFPQNFVRTLGPNEKTTIEIYDLDFLEGHQLYTLCLRDIYGREWELSRSKILNLKKDLFWQGLS